MSPRRCAAGVEEGGRAAPLRPLLLPASEARSHGHVARGSPSPRYVFSALPGVNCLLFGGFSSLLYDGRAVSAVSGCVQKVS